MRNNGKVQQIMDRVQNEGKISHDDFAWLADADQLGANKPDPSAYNEVCELIASGSCSFG